MCCCQLILAWEPLRLSTQSVIFLRLKRVGGVCIVGCGGFCWSFVARLGCDSVEITLVARFVYACGVSASFVGVKVI
jgi:hypothetical protein